MIRIAQISDIHFRPLQRHDEYKEAFKLLFKELNEQKPDIIINTGDMYHLKTSQISSELIEIISWTFTELSKIAPVISILGNHDCFTGDHEVLTKTNGWIKIENLVKNQENEIATFNIKTQEIEFETPHTWISKYVDTELFHVKGKEIDAIVTPDHEFLYSFPGNKKYKNKYLKKQIKNIEPETFIPINGIIKHNEPNFYAELLGFSFAEATFVLKNKTTGACRIQFKLKKAREINYLNNLLESLNYKTNFRLQKDGSVIICIYEKLAKEIYNFFLGKKEIPVDIFKHNKMFLFSFLSGYLKGDGCNNKNNFWTFTTISEKSRDILVSMARLIGCSSHFNNRIIFGNFENSKQQYLGNCNINNVVNFTQIKTIEKIKYSGNVYCASTNNNNLLIKRNNKIYIAGNCNLTNPDRGNIIKTIHNLLNNERLVLLDKSETYYLTINNQKIAIHPFSMIDKKNWNKLLPVPDHTNIALYHGSIAGCKTDSEWIMKDGEENIEYFKDFNFILMGDIHKHQTMRTKIVEQIVDEEQLKKYKSLYGSENIEVIEEI